MALPHLPTSYTTGRNVNEVAITSRRRVREDHNKTWQDNAKYFHDTEMTSTKQGQWARNEDNRGFNGSLESYRAFNERELKTIALSRRRAALDSLLRKDARLWEAKMKNLSGEEYDRLETMREHVNGLKTAREEKRKQLADEKMYDHWRQNNPDVRAIESRTMQNYVVNSWQDQREEKQVAKLQELERERELEAAALETAKKAEESRLFQLRMKQRAEQQAALQLESQMEERREKSEAERRVQMEEEGLLADRWAVDKAMAEYAETQKRRAGEEHGKVLQRQHTARMRRISRQIQEELNADQKLLEQLQRAEADDRQVADEKRGKQRADADWMIGVIREQLVLEKERERELDQMYRDEAEKEWQKREGQWEKEREARHRLMDSVLRERQEQVEERLSALRERREETEEDKLRIQAEQLQIGEIDRRETEEKEREKERLRLDIEAQVTRAQSAAADERAELRIDLEDAAAAEQDYAELLALETSRLAGEPFTPAVGGRRMAWM